jgi:hypothetical protein
MKTIKDLADKLEKRFKPKPKTKVEKRRSIEDRKLAKELGIKVEDL